MGTYKCPLKMLIQLNWTGLVFIQMVLVPLPYQEDQQCGFMPVVLRVVDQWHPMGRLHLALETRMRAENRFGHFKMGNGGCFYSPIMVMSPRHTQTSLLL